MTGGVASGAHDAPPVTVPPAGASAAGSLLLSFPLPCWAPACSTAGAGLALSFGLAWSVPAAAGTANARISAHTAYFIVCSFWPHQKQSERREHHRKNRATQSTSAVGPGQGRKPLKVSASVYSCRMLPA